MRGVRHWLAEKQYSRKARVPEGIFDFIFNIIFRQKLNTVKSNELQSEVISLTSILWSFNTVYIQIQIDIEMRYMMT